MTQWWMYLKGRPFYWALDGENPAAALYMIQRVVERPMNAPARRAARLSLNEQPGILRLRSQLAHSGSGNGYQSLLWRLRLLAEIGGSGDSEPVAEALDRLLDSVPEADAPVARDAILLHISAAFGYPDEPRALAAQQRLVAALSADQLPLDPEARADWLTQVLIALAAVPESLRDLSFLRALGPHLDALDPDALPRYLQFGLPLYDQPDGLALARAALRAGAAGPWLEPWVEQVVAAQDPDGLWRLQRRLPMPADLCWDAQVGQPSRWITAQALFVLRAFYGE